MNFNFFCQTYNVKPSLPDVRDYIYKSSGNVALREKVDLRQWDTIVENQDSLGSCSSNALTNAYELMVKQNYPEQFDHLSRLFVYYNTRLEDGTLSEDVGIYLRDGLKAIKKYGVCTESLWPYDLEQWDNTPSEEAYEDAKKRSIIQYQKLISTYYITEVLNNNKPVVFGMEIYDSFMQLNQNLSTVSLPSRKEMSLGGHAMCMVGYDLKKRLFLAKNSFGSDWGMNGYCWIPFDYIRQEGYDVWTFEITNQAGESNVLSETLPLLPQETLL
jgi:C1A family cysteine protease